MPAAQSITFGLSGEPISLDPCVTSDGNGAYVQTQIYNSLIRFKPGTVDLQPDLALRWTTSDDGLTWTFYLRQNVKFQDGTPLNAEAVRFNFMRWWDPSFSFGANKGFLGWKNNMGGYKGEPGSIVKDVRVKNAYAVDIVLNNPYPALGSLLADSGLFGIASPTAIKKNPLQYGTPAGVAVGTGPFVLRKWTSGVGVELAKNPNYFRAGLPKSDNLTFRFIKEPSSRLNELLTGGVDIAADLLPDQLQALKSQCQVEAAAAPGAQPRLPGPQHQLQAAGGRAGTPGHRGGAQQESHRGRLLERAGPHRRPPDSAAPVQELLQERHRLQVRPGGGQEDCWRTPVIPTASRSTCGTCRSSRPYYPTPKPIAEAMAADLSAIGIKVNLKTEDWAAYLQHRSEGKLQAFMLGYIYVTDADNAYTNLIAPGSTSDISWNSPEVNAAMEAARKQSSHAKRLQLYQKVDEIMFRRLCAFRSCIRACSSPAAQASRAGSRVPRAPRSSTPSRSELHDGTIPVSFPLSKPGVRMTDVKDAQTAQAPMQQKNYTATSPSPISTPGEDYKVYPLAQEIDRVPSRRVEVSRLSRRPACGGCSRNS